MKEVAAKRGGGGKEEEGVVDVEKGEEEGKGGL